jgi:polysaccharide deacetylase family protein (PEP-CTERM system associated)
VPRPRNILTFDVEEYFQVSGFAGVVRGREEGFERRVVPQTLRVLDILDEHAARATFFVLGAAVNPCPGLVGEISRRGHEVASHGWSHECLHERSPEAFRADLRMSRTFLEGITGTAVLGYRAPSFSIRRENRWALRVLAEEGFRYDSSIVPVRHDRYGIPGAHPHAGAVPAGAGRSILEVPPLTRRTPIGRVVAGGGGWFRLFPLWWTVGALRCANAKGRPGVLYFHPWEFDPGQPLVPGVSALARFRHRVGLRGAERKLRGILAGGRFGPAAEVLALRTSRGGRTSASC